MSLVLLKFKGVSEIVGSDEVGLLFLTTEDASRQLSIVCDKAMIYQFGLRLSSAKGKETLLPEVLWQVIEKNTGLDFQILIKDVVGGQYKVFLYNISLQQIYPMRASDAVLLSEIGHIPIYIENKLLFQQSVPNQGNYHNISIPVNSLSVEMLKEALERAIKEEKYEQAAQLRDELKRRNSDQPLTLQ